MGLSGKRAAVFYGSLVSGSAALAVLIFWAFSHLHRPLEYMIAGALATALVLVAIFLRTVQRRLI